MGTAEMQEGWEYADADTQRHVHGIHPYPARMIPQIANRMIKERSSPMGTILDPFCGSGTVLVESLLLGRNGVGTDVNPLAQLIAKVKTTPIASEDLNSEASKLLETVTSRIEASRNGTYSAPIPYFDNISHWFGKSVIEELAIVREAVNQLSTPGPLRDFFQVCFSMTVRKTSNIAFDDNPYFIRAMAEEDIKNHSPDVLATFKKRVGEGVDRVSEFSRICPRNVTARVLLADSRSLPLDECSVDAIVTSPPYGEESHTMSYTRFAKLSLLWMDVHSSKLNRYARETLGANLTMPRAYSELLDKTVAEVSAKSKQRAKEMFSFFWDYAKCLKEMFRVMRSKGFCCIVIGDRTAAGLPVSNGALTKELGELAGFEYVRAYQREIPKKVLPRRDYKVELINRENIVIMQKS